MKQLIDMDTGKIYETVQNGDVILYSGSFSSVANVLLTRHNLKDTGKRCDQWSLACGEAEQKPKPPSDQISFLMAAINRLDTRVAELESFFERVVQLGTKS